MKSGIESSIDGSSNLGCSKKSQSDLSMILTKHVFKSYSNNKNMVFSPLSIQIALALVAAGCEGSSLDQLLSFFGVNSINELNSVYPQLVTNLLAYGSSQGGPRLSVANALWIDKTESYKHNFKQIADTVYKAASKSVDFRNHPGEALDEINQWAEDETNGLIKNLLAPGTINNTTVTILTNALYFKGKWYKEYFNDGKSRDLEFYFLNGNSVKAPFMTPKYGKHYLQAFNGFKVLKLSYKACNLSMCIILPDAYDGLPALLEKISAESGFLGRHMPFSEVIVGKFLLPKFKITFDFEASNLLKGADFGLNSLFTGEGITEMVNGNDPMFVTKVIHKAFIEVNEQGTEVAAATAITMRYGCSLLREHKILDFVADHPFLFVIKDDATDTILFTGTLLNPCD